MLAKYLLNKLHSLNIHNVNEIRQHGYCRVFQWLRQLEPSISYRALFDIYCACYDVPLNSLNMQEQEKILLSYKEVLPSYIPLSENTVRENLEAAQVEAENAANNGEIPIGAVIVQDGRIIARGFNQTLCNGDIMGHAEIVALQMAQQVLHNHRLCACDLYVTIEPCLMCAGAITQARIQRVIFGAIEPKTGALVSQYKVLDNLAVNHHTEVVGPIDNEYYSQQIRNFLQYKRNIT